MLPAKVYEGIVGQGCLNEMMKVQGSLNNHYLIDRNTLTCVSKMSVTKTRLNLSRVLGD